MDNEHLYNEMYQAGYEIACKNCDSSMIDDMLSLCKISYEMRYEIACKYHFKEEIIHTVGYIDKETAFIIACGVGNIEEAFDTYEKNIDYFYNKAREGIILTALLGAYMNKHYGLILKFVEIYQTSDDLITKFARVVITNIADDDKMFEIGHNIKKEQIFIDDILKYLPMNIAFKLACSCYDNRIVDYLLQNDTINKRECFISACINGNEYVIKKLRDSCRWHYNEMLELTCKYTKNLDVVKLLVDYGADNIAECKVMAVNANFIDAVKFFNDIGF